MTVYQDEQINVQIDQCINLLNDILRYDLLGVYLYGSAVVGGLQRYSDMDLFVVSNRDSTYEEKSKLATELLQISGVYMKSSKPPIEMTIVNKSDVNPWRYPPKFDFQYGDWLRKEFESGNFEPWAAKEMPDLAILITQALLANKILLGPEPNELLCKVPYHDFMRAISEGLGGLMEELGSDTRNVLLTYARIWSTVETDAIHTKPAAADWAIERLPDNYRPVMKRAKAICVGDEDEHWDDVKSLIQPCAQFILNQINKRISAIEFSGYDNKSIKIADS